MLQHQSGAADRRQVVTGWHSCCCRVNVFSFSADMIDLTCFRWNSSWLSSANGIQWIKTMSYLVNTYHNTHANLLQSIIHHNSLTVLWHGFTQLEAPYVRTPHPKFIPVKHPPSMNPFPRPLIKVSLCRKLLRLIYLIRFVLFPQSKPHGTLLPPVIKGSKSGAGPV